MLASNNLIKKEDLAKELNISLSMVDKLIAQGCPKYKIGKAVRFDIDEVKNWIKEKNNK